MSFPIPPAVYPTINYGDMVIFYPVDFNDLHKGDIVAFSDPLVSLQQLSIGLKIYKILVPSNS